MRGPLVVMMIIECASFRLANGISLLQSGVDVKIGKMNGRIFDESLIDSTPECCILAVVKDHALHHSF